ncbi:MAG TPA: hypothetical protein VF817_02535 [Patescibacteria group bacterium]
MVKWKLTPQGRDFMDDLEQTLLLPTERSTYHEWLQDCIKYFRMSDDVVADHEKETCRMLEIIGKYTDVKYTNNSTTSDAFYELYHRLTSLFKNFSFIEDSRINAIKKQILDSHE